MHWQLFSATWLVVWRRARPVLAANPLLALLLCVLVAATPAGGAVLGATYADAFAAAGRQPGYLDALALGLGATALVVGVAVALLAPADAALARQLEAAPVPRASLVGAVTVAPIATAVATAVALVAPFAVALAGSAAPALLLAPVACGAVGATLAEAARLLLRRRAVGAAYALAAAAAWAAAGAASGRVEAGPAAALVDGVHGSAGGAALAGLVAAVGAAALWEAALATPRAPSAAPHAVRRAVRLPGRGTTAFAVALGIRIGRHRQLRLHAAATVVLPVAATVALAVALGVSGGPAAAFCAALALPAAAVLPAAARGLAADGAWLHRTSPQSPRALAASASAAGVVVALAAVAAAVAGIAPFARGDASLYLELEAATAFALGCAALAGALVPWRSERVVQQLASYGALVVAVVVCWAFVARLEPLAASAGLGGVAFSIAAGNLTLAAGALFASLVRL